MPLTSLPNELLTKILEIVNDDCPLTNISLTCKRLNDVAQPLLYGSFWQQNGHNMGEFARAIIKRPSLAGHVKIFGGSTIQPGLKFRDTTRGDINLPGVNNGDLTNEQLQWMRGSLPDAIHGQEFCNAWYDELVDSFDNWDAVLAFLLLICSSHLTFLMLRTAITNSPYVQAVLEQAIKEQHASSHDALLSNLKQVDLEYDTKAGKRGRGMKASFVLPFFRLKSVVDISITGIQSDLALSSIFQEEHISIIKHLTIIDSQISASSMENILRCFTSLQLFEYQHAPQKFDSNTNFIPISIINGLERSKHCLKELHLGKKSLPGYPYETLYPWDEYKPVETLNDFEKLSALSVDAFILLDYKILNTEETVPASGFNTVEYPLDRYQAAVAALPASLEALHIKKCKASIFRFLAALIPEKGPKLPPKLNSIRLFFNVQGKPFVLSSIWEYWQQRALEKGIALARHEI